MQILQGTLFDTATGEVSIEAKRPWLLQRNAKEFNHAEVTEKIGWKITCKKSYNISFKYNSNNQCNTKTIFF